ncbi:MAG: hypothetical protein ACOCVO_01060 [bacterium]
MTSAYLGMLFGFINTSTLHLSKGMQRQGIETLRWWKLPRSERSSGKAFIYIGGVILNNMTPFWLILANRFAAPAYATGMFGLGLVVLLIYSHFILGEPVDPVNYAGAGLIVAGTVLFALHAISHGRVSVSQFDPVLVGWIAGGYVVGAGLFALFVVRTGRRFLFAAAFGLLSGGMASLDPVMKALGQWAGGIPAFLPVVAWGWLPFLASFVLGTAAFLASQFAFLKGADASTMVPVQTSVYVLLPVVVQLAALPDYDLTPTLALGMLVISGGIVMTQMGRRTEQTAPGADGRAVANAIERALARAREQRHSAHTHTREDS